MKVLGRLICIQCEKEIDVEETIISEADAKRYGLSPGDTYDFYAYCSEECREKHHGKLEKEAAKRKKRRDSRRNTKTSDPLQAKAENI